MWKAVLMLLSSRKFILVVLGLVAAGGARIGFDWSAEAMLVAISPFLVAIGAIAHEDAAAKSAGAGTVTTTTTAPLPKGGEAVVTTVEPDPANKP